MARKVQVDRYLGLLMTASCVAFGYVMYVNGGDNHVLEAVTGGISLGSGLVAANAFVESIRAAGRAVRVEEMLLNHGSLPLAGDAVAVQESRIVKAELARNAR